MASDDGGLSESILQRQTRCLGEDYMCVWVCLCVRKTKIRPETDRDSIKLKLPLFRNLN